MLLLKRLDVEKTLETLNTLPLTIDYGVTWDTKDHDNTIVVDPDQPDLATRELAIGFGIVVSISAIGRVRPDGRRKIPCRDGSRRPPGC